MGTIDLNLLRAFVAVAETSSFSAAAKKLELPKSSVSRAIAALESRMKVRLVHRTTRSVALSTAGTSLYERVAPILATLDGCVGTLPELESQPSGDLRVTASIDFAPAVLAEIVARFVARYPSVHVEVRVTNTYVDLVAEGIDVALRISGKALKDSSLVARRAGSIALGIFAGPTYLARRGTPRTPRDLDGHDWVIAPRPESIRLESSGETVHVTPRGRIACDDMSFAHEAVRAGGGIGLLPMFLADADVASGELVRVLPRWNTVSGILWIVSPNAAHEPRKVTAFREFVIDSLRSSALRST